MTFELTSEQRAAIQMVKDNHVSILTGGPGTGKTTTCKEIIKEARKNEKRVALCAPSGKAAKRMSEATGQFAMTIHKLLEARMENDTFVFGRDERYPIEADLIICDEVSMVSSDLMARLLQATRPGQRVLFVGDQDQLPSVGAGAVLRDFLASSTIPHVELTKIHRNSGKIVEACHRIKHGRSYSPSPKLELPLDNLRHIEAQTPQAVVDVIAHLLTNNIEARGYDPIWDVQVISPWNRNSLMGCEHVNQVLQEKLNDNPPIDKYLFKPGDKAIQTRNQTVKSQDGPDYIVNGDLCEIVRVEKKRIVAKFFYPEREVYLSRKDNHLLLAYAITCHRFQGSEAPVVIIPVHKHFSYFVTRPWIYTAISRAQDICITVGQFAAIDMAIQKSYSNKRVTKLEERLKAVSSKIAQVSVGTILNRQGRPKRVVRQV